MRYDPGLSDTPAEIKRHSIIDMILLIIAIHDHVDGAVLVTTRLGPSGIGRTAPPFDGVPMTTLVIATDEVIRTERLLLT